MVNQILMGAFRAALGTVATRNVAPEAQIPMLDHSRGPDRLPPAASSGILGGRGRLLAGVVIARGLALMVLAPAAAGFQAAEMVMRLGLSKSSGLVAGGLLGLTAAFAGLLLVLRFVSNISHLSSPLRATWIGMLPALAGGVSLAFAVFWLAAAVLTGLIGSETLSPWAIGRLQAPAWQAGISTIWYLVVPSLLLHVACGYMPGLVRG